MQSYNKIFYACYTSGLFLLNAPIEDRLATDYPIWRHLIPVSNRNSYLAVVDCSRPSPACPTLDAALYSRNGIGRGYKIAFMGWGIGMQLFDFTGISGQTAFSTVVFPTLFRLALHRQSLKMQTDGFYLGLLLGCLIGVSRIYLEAHSISEVATGFILGITASYTLLSHLKKAGPAKIHCPFQEITSVFLCASLLSSPPPTRRLLHSVAIYLTGIPAPYTRLQQ